MIKIFIRSFVTIFFSFYIYMKLLNINLRSKPYIQVYLISSLILSGLTATISHLRSYIYVICISLSYILIITLYTKTKVRLSIITGVLSYGISSIIYVISAMAGSILVTALGYDSDSGFLFLMLSIAFFHSLFAILLFRIKRLKKGMPFLTEPATNNIGIIIALLALACIIILSTNDASLIYIIPITIVIICAVIIIIWWNKRLTRTYLNRKRDAELTKLHKTIEEKNEYIEKLKLQNVILGKLIHKDNKLIPATELAVTDLLINYRDKDADEIEATAEHILADLKMKSADRREILDSLDMKLKQLPRTGLTSVDLLFSQLTAKAAKAHVLIDLTLHANIKYLVQNIIDEADLNILFAELIENAIITIGQNEVRKVLITLELADSFYVINVFDSGDRLSSEVLKNIGIKPITARDDNGGIDIGLIKISETVKKYEASLIIDELFSSKNFFTKKVSVRFDQKNEYILRSNRTDISEILSNRPDLILDTKSNADQ